MYAAIAAWEATNDEVYPGLARLGRDIRKDRQQAKRYIRELREAGLLRVSPRIVAGKKERDTNRYEFLWNPEYFGPFPKGGVTDEPTVGVNGEPTSGVSEDPTVGSKTTDGSGQKRPPIKNIDHHQLKRSIRIKPRLRLLTFHLMMMLMLMKTERSDTHLSGTG